MKKSLSLLVAIAMVFSMFATAASASTESAGQYLKGIGVIQGDGTNLYENDNWKRQDVAIIIARLLGKETEAKNTANTHGFSDVRGEFYNGYISWAKEQKLMEGTGNGAFGFDGTVSNQEFAAVVLRALGADTTGENYAKVPELAGKFNLLPEGTDYKAAAVRGVTYDVIKKALDTVVEGKGQKLGTILNLPGYEITELAIAKAFAVVKSSVNVEFNAAVSALKSEDVTVTDADGNAVLVEKVTVDGTKATVALSENLQSAKTYTVKVAAATSAEGFEGKDLSAEFKYEATKAATVEFASTTIAYDVDKTDELKIVIKDAAGNNVTANYDSSDIEVKSNDESVIEDFDAKKIGEAIVNVVVTIGEEETIETGNQIITVKGALSAAINDVTFEGEISDKDLKVFNSNPDADRQIKFEAEDQAGNKYKFESLVSGREDLKDVTFKSLNPTRLVVDEKEGTYTTLQTGSVTVQISAKVQGVTVTKSVVVTIEEAPKFTGIEVSSSSVKLVEGSDLAYTFEVKTVDQYGDAIEVTEQEYKVTSNKSDIIAVDSIGTFAEGKATVTLDGLKNGSASIKVEYKFDNKTYTKTVSASQVAQNGFGGYNAVLEASKINVTPNNDKAKDIKKDAKLTVYLKDKNGNNYDYADKATLEVTQSGEGEVTITSTGNAGEYNVEAAKAGNVTLTIKAGDSNKVTVATVKVEVINSAPAISKVVQAKSTITVKETATDADFKALIFGKNSALVVTDQHGDEVKAEDITLTGSDAKASIASANQAIIGSDGSVNGDGKTTITVSINKQFFIINVVVTEVSGS